MTQISVEQAIQIAIQHHQAGRLAEAEQIYRQVLAQHPRHDGALHLLGVIACQVGRQDVAMDLIGQAIAFNPNVPDYFNNLGNAFRQAGRKNEALHAYQQALRLNPQFAEGHTNLANVLREQGRLDEAIAANRRAIELRPDYADAYSNLGTALGEKGEFDPAIRAFRRALQLRPDFADAHFNMGTALRDKGEIEQSILSYGRAIELKPDFVMAHFNLGNVLRDQGRFEEAMARHRRVIELSPAYADAHNNLANSLKDSGRAEEAIAAYRHAISLTPRDGPGPVDPHHANMHWNFALALLLLGDFKEGWEEYEWRFRCAWYAKPPACPQPPWDPTGGEDITGRTILLHAEQGLGDTIQFVRYAALVAERGARVIVRCAPLLTRLLKGAAGVADTVSTDDPLPAFDCHFPLLSLPRAFGTALQTIPAPVPYIKIPDQNGAGNWPQKIAQLESDTKRSGALRVGLVWAGNSAYKNDHNRSVALSRLRPLAAARPITFHSLQKGAAALQAARPPAGMDLMDLTADLHDFADTAGLMAQLDLIISVDTAAAHLAGALGKPVWLLLPFAPDWRWLTDRTDSPWYPTMRLFRQRALGDWDSVVRAVVEALPHFPPQT